MKSFSTSVLAVGYTPSWALKETIEQATTDEN